MTDQQQLTVEEYELLRQAAYNQRNDERSAADRIECSNCRGQARKQLHRRSIVLEAALKKIKPKEAS